MVRGWWWIKDPEELYHTLQALHPRGVREKVLHKHLAKHMESLAEMCTKSINGKCCWCSHHLSCVVEYGTCSICMFLLFFLKLVLCCFWLDPIFELKVEQKDVLMEALQQPWQVQEKAMDTDISALQWVEDLEQRVVAADLHMKVRNHLCHYFPYADMSFNKST